MALKPTYYISGETFSIESDDSLTTLATMTKPAFIIGATLAPSPTPTGGYGFSFGDGLESGVYLNGELLFAFVMIGDDISGTSYQQLTAKDVSSLDRNGNIAIPLKTGDVLAVRNYNISLDDLDKNLTAVDETYITVSIMYND